MITCKEATKFISQKEEGKLSLRQRWQLWMHLGVCAVCRIFERQNKVIIKNAPHLHEHLNASLSVLEKESIVAALEKGS
ncbi:MAG TPA: hypothetical protein PLA68_04880 [Panacibacter sp.]|nr:hypothetical protein [Panacibacter sp.]